MSRLQSQSLNLESSSDTEKESSDAEPSSDSGTDSDKSEIDSDSAQGSAVNQESSSDIGESEPDSDLEPNSSKESSSNSEQSVGTESAADPSELEDSNAAELNSEQNSTTEPESNPEESDGTESDPSDGDKTVESDSSTESGTHIPIQRTLSIMQTYTIALSTLQQEITTKDEEIHQLREMLENQLHWTIERNEVRLLDEELGRGAYGWVREAIFRGCKVAVKCLHNEIVSEYNLHIFSREMNMAARCRHPNLLQFIGATRDTDRPPFIVTELMHTSLRRVLEQNQLTSEQIVPILLGVARGLNYLHKNSPPILHRDISSSNVLLNPLPNNQWLPKLGDFGSFNFVQESNTNNAGNPAYAAPEALDPSRGPQTPAMDVFSFGVLTNEICTRRQPSGNLTVTTVNQQTTRRRSPERYLAAITVRCIDVDITQRCDMDCYYTIEQLW